MASAADNPNAREVPAISIRNLCKHYEVRSASEMRWVNLVLPRYVSRDHRINHKVLDDVTFDVPPGCKMALVGENGSGKSTLLKLIAGLIKPSAGHLDINGSVLPLLELGAGFHPDLTGYENVFLQAAILGIPREEIRSRLGEIVEFSGLEDFMETPVKYYSSGMFARLGFSVAIHCNPDILLVDEILAVGDADFQDKSFNKLMEFVGEGRTLILVSHNLFGLREICDQAVWLDEGRIREIGAADEVVESYMIWNLKRAEPFEPGRREDIALPKLDRASLPDCAIHSIRFLDETGAPCPVAQTQAPLEIEIECECSAKLDQVECSVLLFADKRDAAIELDGAEADNRLTLPAGRSKIRIAVRRLKPLPGKYRVGVELLHNTPDYAAVKLATAHARLVVVDPANADAKYLLDTNWKFDLKQ